MSDLPEHNPYDPPRAPIGPTLSPAASGEYPKAEHIDGPPLLTIWTRPRSKIRTLVDTRPTYGVLPLAAVWGSGTVLGELLSDLGSSRLSPRAVLALSMIAGPMAGVLAIFFCGWSFQVAGRWLRGWATAREMRAALAWGTLPSLPSHALLFAWFFAFKDDFFVPAPFATSNPRLPAYLICQLVFGVWSLIVSLKTIGEIQRFSALKALASSILAGLAVLIPGACFILVYSAIRTRT